MTDANDVFRFEGDLYLSPNSRIDRSAPMTFYQYIFNHLSLHKNLKLFIT